MRKKRKILIEEYLDKYVKELEELSDKELKSDYIGWFHWEYDIEELEAVERDEMLHDLTEDKRRYLKDYKIEELEDYISNT
tara:strand:- start:385 stop:627 length:243 start_codon:yes stop_codon:yes gene_type:complete